MQRDGWRSVCTVTTTAKLVWAVLLVLVVLLVLFLIGGWAG